MNIDISTLFPDLEALTPDGRWNMLQDWLSKNPEYGENVDRWSSQTREQVFDEICQGILKKYGPLGVAFATTLKPKIMRAIEIMQACYRERANENIYSHNNQPNQPRRKRKLHGKTTTKKN